METIFLLLAALLLTLAATAAVLATPRAEPRLAPRWGVPLLLGLFALGVWALRPGLGGVEAVAWALAAVGVVIPLVSLATALRRAGRRTRAHGA